MVPQSALSRVFFLPQAEIVQYFQPSFLPKGHRAASSFLQYTDRDSIDYGGSLPALTHLDDPLRMNEAPLTRPQDQNQSYDSPPAFNHSRSISLSPTSPLNPFFGYPASSRCGLTSLQHGRRRKRDLARTLVLLFWLRWRKGLIIGLLLVVCAITVKLVTKRRLLRFQKGALGWRVLLPLNH
jgi:hypothetical protein